jgi:hypothetical protein
MEYNSPHFIASSEQTWVQNSTMDWTVYTRLEVDSMLEQLRVHEHKQLRKRDEDSQSLVSSVIDPLCSLQVMRFAHFRDHIFHFSPS